MSSARVLFVGRATLDVVYSVDDFPAEDTKVFAGAMHVAPGGPATNAAITYALLGGSAVLMTAIGGGPWAARVQEELDGLGIKLIDLAEGSSYETPLTAVLASKRRGTRTIVNPPRTDLELMRPEAWKPAWGGAPALVLTDGFLLAETLPLLSACRARGAQICLDGGSWKSGTEELAGLLSIAICSERFLVPGQPGDGDATIAWLAERGVQHIAITRGANSILGWDQGRRFEVEFAPVIAVDTTGAGDVLHGAFCYEFNRAGRFEEALRFASRIASQSCTAVGIRGWMTSQS